MSADVSTETTIRDLTAEVVRAVESVHEPIDALDVRSNRERQVCAGCGTDNGNWQPWPCPTVRRVRAALDAAGTGPDQ